VSTEAVLGFQLDAIAERAVVKVYNNAAQLVMTRELTNVQNDQLRLNVKDMPAGNYLVRVETSLGVRTLKMTVQH